MKHLLFSLLFISFSYAQNDSGYFISLENSNNKEIESNFYINRIYDGRQVKDNIGTVQKSLFNTKVMAYFKKPFIEELENFLIVCYPNKEHKKGLDVRIDELYVSEITSSGKETGFATVVLDIIEKKNGRDVIIGNFSSTIESNGLDVTNKHSQRLIRAIAACFESYKLSTDKDRLNIEFISDEKITAKIPNFIKEGVYLNYLDIFNGGVLNLDDFMITNYEGKKCLVNKKSGRLENNFYGFSDGKDFYINLFRFSAIKLYAKTEMMGDYYFVDSVKTNSIDFSSIKAAYGGGIVGGLLFPDLNETDVPLLLDRVTGSPLFLTNKFMVNLLSTDKELLKGYKHTSRTIVDKKDFYKKYFGL